MVQTLLRPTRQCSPYSKWSSLRTYGGLGSDAWTVWKFAKFPGETWNPFFLAKKLPLPWAQNRSIGLEVVIFVLPACVEQNPGVQLHHLYLLSFQDSFQPSNHLITPLPACFNPLVSRHHPTYQPGGDAMLCLFGPQLLSERSRDRWSRWVFSRIKKTRKTSVDSEDMNTY